MNMGIKRERLDYLVGDQLVEFTRIKPNDTVTSGAAEKLRAILSALKAKHREATKG